MHYRQKTALHIKKKKIYHNSLLFKVLAWLALPYEHLSIFKLPLDKIHKQFLKLSRGNVFLHLPATGEKWQNPSLKCIRYLPFPEKKPEQISLYSS